MAIAPPVFVGVSRLKGERIMADKKRTTGKACQQRPFERDANLVWEAIRPTAQQVLEDEQDVPENRLSSTYLPGYVLDTKHGSLTTDTAIPGPAVGEQSHEAISGQAD